MYHITVTFANSKQPAILLKDVDAGKTLLEVCLENDVEINHECGGIASCTTCCVQVLKGNQFFEPSSRREQQILAKKNKNGDDLRLACQCLLLEGSGSIQFILPDGSAETR